MLKETKVMIDNNSKNILNDISEQISRTISDSLDNIKTDIETNIDLLGKNIKKIEKNLSEKSKDTDSIVVQITEVLKSYGSDWL